MNEYHMSLEDIGNLTQEQLEALVPLKDTSDESDYIARAISMWNKDNPDRQSDYFRDILPIVNRLKAG